MLRSRFGATGLLSDLLSRAREHGTEQRHLRRRLVGALGGELRYSGFPAVTIPLQAV